MARSTDELHVAAWTTTGLDEALLLTRFMLPEHAHTTLLQWCVERTGRANQPTYIVLAGLSEILAFLVPEIAYMDPRARSVPGAGIRLALYMVGDRTGDRDLRRRVVAAINLWLGTIYGNKDPEVRDDVARSAGDDENWVSIEVHTRLQAHDGICAIPENRLLYDALVAHAVDHLSGRSIRFASGEERTLVARTPHSSPFEGIDLVAFPPKKHPSRDAYYSEVVTIKAATFPERKEAGIHILARPSIRNWAVPVGYDLTGSPARSLDLFMPSEKASGGLDDYRHTSFPFKALVENWEGVRQRREDRRIVARWESHRDHRIYDLLRRLVSPGSLADGDGIQMVSGRDGLWVLPRLAPGSGDRYLAGGTGVGWPDRLDISNSLDAPLGDMLLERAPTMRRISKTMSVESPFSEAAVNAGVLEARRAALIKTLGVLGNGKELDFLVLHGLEGTPATVRDKLAVILGEPARRDGTMTWEDGLTINIVEAPAGILAEALRPAALTDAERAGRTERQIGEMLRARENEIGVEAARRMAAWVRGIRVGRTGVACTILEMAANLQGQRGDPYTFARRELARQRVLPQVVLWDDEGVVDDKYKAAIGDCLRMLGVLPPYEEDLRYAPAALSVIQRNASNGVEKQSFPLAARVKEGILECAVPTDEGEPNWQPYGLAALAIFAGEYGRFNRGRDEENLGRFHMFYDTALEQIDDAAGASKGGGVVLLDGDRLGTIIKSLQNGNLALDNLQVGNRSFRPADLPNVRMVRFVSDDEKLPTYYHLEDTAWPGGLFAWDDGARTAYGLKRKPKPMSKFIPNALISRHLAPGDNKVRDDKPRRLAAMDEICAVFCQPDDDLAAVRMAAHRLRQVHTQYGGDTRLPFPLHELQLLGRAVTS
ncbi:RNaseH domain-containing protein [uncultured Methylobacterium sp.]|uniref:RNaseH domain-containing protein n=1 Tax=uncultured Methylobacterium sp. TaxID=157278 RepID=UPI0035CBC6C4